MYLLTAARQEAHRLAATLATALDRTAESTGYLGDARDLTARPARRDLQVSIIALGIAHDDGLSGSRQQRATAERLGAAVAAAERLGYLTVAACWAAGRKWVPDFVPADVTAVADARPDGPRPAE